MGGLQFQRFSPLLSWKDLMICRHTQCWRRGWVEKELHLDPNGKWSESLGVTWTYMKPQIPLPQWHTSSNKAIHTPTRPYFLVVLLPLSVISFQTTICGITHSELGPPTSVINRKLNHRLSHRSVWWGHFKTSQHTPKFVSLVLTSFWNSRFLYLNVCWYQIYHLKYSSLLWPPPLLLSHHSQ